ncbi:Uu.00g145100.m01.CDS01 [Anthostomella pinea]|uniref:Uu.00g145100.m01.CDS01 n=1 Tax=Anthostomella pinea TaxID=933095 RepID=A0AAI8YLV3_9PEZI|nr:Uu.00g145100.m01.CDS01 [Anthostomella pinea]
MKFTTLSFTSVLAISVAAKHDGSFAVLRFNNEGGKFSTEGRMDPVVSPGTASGHSHGIMGGSNFGLTVNGPDLLDSKCTNALIVNDKSNYWVPNLWFQSPKNSTFKKVPLDYMSVYYKFDTTNDDIKAFPSGLKIVSGDAMKRTPPATGGLQLDPSQGEIQAVQWTCPTANTNEDRYPPGSDGTKAGMVDPNNKGSGAGFPVVNCDGVYSPLRQDIHLPSCYNPAAGLDDYANNMAFPTANGNALDCPEGWTHVPHLFYEIYYSTTDFENEWDEDGAHQPFVLSNGDRTGFSSHADFISGWDVDTLQTMIDGCNAGDAGMDKCPKIIGGINTSDKCQIESAVPDPSEDWITALPGNNPLAGWGV